MNIFMKKFLISLSDYLVNFWFVIMLLIIGFSLVAFAMPLPWLISFSQSGNLNWLAIILSYSLNIFFLPLALISTIIALIIWLKKGLSESRHGLTALIFILI